MDWAGFASIGGVFFACALSYRCSLEQGRHGRGHRTHRQSAGVTLTLVALDGREGIRKYHSTATSKIGWSGWTMDGKLFLLDPSLWRAWNIFHIKLSVFAVENPSTRQLLKIRWPFLRAVNYGFCSSSVKAGIAGGGPNKKTHGKHKSLKVDDLQSVWFRVCSSIEMHERCESTLSHAEKFDKFPCLPQLWHCQMSTPFCPVTMTSDTNTFVDPAWRSLDLFGGWWFQFHQPHCIGSHRSEGAGVSRELWQ